GNFGAVSWRAESATDSPGSRSRATLSGPSGAAAVRPGEGTAVLVGLGLDAPAGAGRVVRFESGGLVAVRCRAESARAAAAGRPGTRGVGKSLSGCSNVAMR